MKRKKWKLGWWTYAMGKFGRSIRLGNGHIVAMAFSGKLHYLDKDNKAESNARLIAAAPELLDALKNLVEKDLLKDEYHIQARQAIAKATK